MAINALPAFVPAAHAQKSEKDAETAKRVLELIRDGNAAFDEEKYGTALEQYEQAYSLYPDPAILVRLGKTSEKLGQNRKAIEYYREFARLMPDDPAAKKLAQRAADLQKEMPMAVTVTSEPQGAQIFLDKALQQPLGTTPAEIALTAGEHTLYVKKKGFETSAEQVTITADGPQTVSVTLTRGMISEREGQPGEPADAEASSLVTYGYATLGVGVLSLATSGTFSYFKGVAEDDVNDYDKRAPGASRSQLQERKDDANSYYDTALYTGVVGGVLTATGVGLLTYHYLSADAGDDEVAWSVGASFDADAAWLGVNGSF